MFLFRDCKDEFKKPLQTYHIGSVRSAIISLDTSYIAIATGVAILRVIDLNENTGIMSSGVFMACR